MQLGLLGKVALVTGASRGIGAAIAQELAREGCDVAITARSESGLYATAESIRREGRRCWSKAVDLREADAPREVVSAALAALGALDFVICNAGATKRGDFLSLTEEDWADGFALKFTAHRRLVARAWDSLKASSGCAVFISGVGGRTPGAEFAIGGSVNAALLSLAKALAERGISDGVRVNVVNPGAVATGRLRTRIRELAERESMTESEAEKRLAADLGIAGFGHPADVASTVAFLCSRRAGHLHGAVIDVDGGQTKSF